MTNLNVVATAIAARVNEVASIHHAGHDLTANDILNVAQAIATDPDVALLFQGIVDRYSPGPSAPSRSADSARLREVQNRANNRARRGDGA